MTSGRLELRSVTVERSYARAVHDERPSRGGQRDRDRWGTATPANRGPAVGGSCCLRAHCRCRSVEQHVHLLTIPQAVPLLTGTKTYGQISLRVGLRMVVTYLRATLKKVIRKCARGGSCQARSCPRFMRVSETRPAGYVRAASVTWIDRRHFRWRAVLLCYSSLYLPAVSDQCHSGAPFPQAQLFPPPAG